MKLTIFRIESVSYLKKPINTLVFNYGFYPWFGGNVETVKLVFIIYVRHVSYLHDFSN